MNLDAAIALSLQTGKEARMRTILILGSALLASACAMNENMSQPPSARATLISAQGEARGEVLLTETASGIDVRVNARGLAAGARAVHVHAVGRCDAPDFTTAGPHWNPTGRQHGTENPQGPHRGDMPNLDVRGDGTAELRFQIVGARLDGMLDDDGASVVIHAGPDDYRSDPAGNSGARIACGVVMRN